MVQNVRLWNEDGTQGVRALTRALSDLEVLHSRRLQRTATCDFHKSLA
jgi:hypothetical protein